MIFPELKSKYQNVIGIDPDVTKSGVATIDVNTRQMSISTLTFPKVVEVLLALKDTQDTLIVIEAGWLIKTNWHIRYEDNRRTAAAKGNTVGRNHEVGRKMVELCDAWNIPHIEIKPLPKKWRGPDHKITQEEFQMITKCTQRTNQEGRDAGLIAWLWADRV